MSPNLIILTHKVKYARQQLHVISQGKKCSTIVIQTKYAEVIVNIFFKNHKNLSAGNMRTPMGM